MVRIHPVKIPLLFVCFVAASMMATQGSLKSLGVEVVDASGELVGANMVKAVETGKTFTAKDIILAPGSLPFVPPGVQVREAAILHERCGWWD